MSLDGLRAWIGEVERKLHMRTRVFLALSVIAIGIAAASVYLAIDVRENSVSESDVQALQQQLEAQIGEGGAATASPPIESEPNPGTGKNGATGTTNGAANSGSSAAKLPELLQKAKERAAQGE